MNASMFDRILYLIALLAASGVLACLGWDAAQPVTSYAAGPRAVTTTAGPGYGRPHPGLRMPRQGLTMDATTPNPPAGSDSNGT